MNTFEKLKNIVEVISNSDLEHTMIGPAELKQLAKNIEKSVFYESEGDALAINCLHYLLPNSCRIVGLPDEALFFMCADVLEAVSGLSEGGFPVDEISAGENDEETYYVHFRLRKKPEKLAFSSEKINDPKKLFDAIASSRLRIRYKLLQQNFLTSYTLWDIYDEDGAAIVCYLPQSIVASVSKVIVA